MSSELIGKIVNCTITGVKDYGFFVTFEGNRNGFVHISEISDYYILNIKEYAQVTEEIDLMVISYEEEGGRYFLSYKEIFTSYKAKNKGKIIRTKDDFVKLKDSLDWWEKNYKFY